MPASLVRSSSASRLWSALSSPSASLLNLVLECSLGQRVSAETEIAGLDLPEMGQLGYPEFVFTPEPEYLMAAGKACSRVVMPFLNLLAAGRLPCPAAHFYPICFSSTRITMNTALNITSESTWTADRSIGAEQFSRFNPFLPCSLQMHRHHAAAHVSRSAGA